MSKAGGEDNPSVGRADSSLYTREPCEDEKKGVNEVEKKKAPAKNMGAEKKKPYYERYWWVPWAISGTALLISIIKPVLYRMI